MPAYSLHFDAGLNDLDLYSRSPRSHKSVRKAVFISMYYVLEITVKKSCNMVMNTAYLTAQSHCVMSLLVKFVISKTVFEFTFKNEVTHGGN